MTSFFNRDTNQLCIVFQLLGDTFEDRFDIKNLFALPEVCPQPRQSPSPAQQHAVCMPVCLCSSYHSLRTPRDTSWPVPSVAALRKTPSLAHAAWTR